MLSHVHLSCMTHTPHVVIKDRSTPLYPQGVSVHHFYKEFILLFIRTNVGFVFASVYFKLLLDLETAAALRELIYMFFTYPSYNFHLRLQPLTVFTDIGSQKYSVHWFPLRIMSVSDAVQLSAFLVPFKSYSALVEACSYAVLELALLKSLLSKSAEASVCVFSCQRLQDPLLFTSCPCLALDFWTYLWSTTLNLVT